MNYTFKIIDTQRDDLTTLIERAEGGSVVLEWMGGDKKDELTIVGSRLSFRMVGMSMEDGQYSDLFTGDETRYRVTMEDENGALIWQGFLLPDSYSEPYTNAPILVDFTATDGLGRLKGKYLPDDFYEEEKSVIQILSNCLKLTGLGLDFRFAPAIENHIQKDYNLIYLDTSLYKEKEKKQDAYKILNDLLESMACTLYQADNYYNIEGLNIRNFRVYEAKVYDVDGAYIEEQEITRLLKTITATGVPIINLQPPYGNITVSHQREPLSFPDTLSKEINDGWVVFKNVEDPIYATDWMGHFGMIATAGENMAVNFEPSIDPEGYISLKQRLYVRKGQKLKLTLGFKLNPKWELDQERREELVTSEWDTPFLMDLRIHYKGTNLDDVPSIALRNYFPGGDSSIGRYFHLQFEPDGTFKKEIQFIPNFSGALDVRIYTPQEIWAFTKSVDITELSLEELAFEEEYSSTVTHEGYTTEKDLELTFADDATGLSKSFRLQRLKEAGEQNLISVPVISDFQKDGKWYSVTDLKGANLIADNIDHVSVPVTEVIYNYNNSQDHVVVTGEQVTEFIVTVNDLNALVEDRDYWEQWSDSRYSVQQKRYCDVAAEIIRLSTGAALHKMDVTAHDNIKFNDFIDFNFMGSKQFMLSSCRWDIDRGMSDLTAAMAFYGVQAGVNLPPVVEAGPDIFMDAASTTAGLSAEAYDPDGFIVSYQWEEITSNGAGFMQGRSKSDITITNLTEDYYEFMVTVTDNDGATASDTVKLYRYQETDVKVQIIDEGNPGGNQKFEVWKLTLSPEILERSEVNIYGTVYIETEGYVYAEVTLTQDGVEKRNLFGGSMTYGDETRNESIPFSLNYVAGSEVTFEIKLNHSLTSAGTGKAGFTIENAEFVEGSGMVNVPIGSSRSISHS